MSDIDPEKLKVAELRDELKARGLDTKGNKAALVARLKESLSETPASAKVADDGEDTEPEDAGGETNFEENVVDEVEEGNGEEEAQMDAAGDANVVQNGEEKEVADDGEEAQADVEMGDGGDQEEQAQQEGAEEAEEEVVLGEEFQTIDEASQDDTEEGDTSRKRKRSRSPRHRRSRSRSRERHRGHDRRRERFSPPPRKVEMEDTAWESATEFAFDRYNADLNLKIDDKKLKALPLTMEGFAYMWSGVRATYGVNTGKVAYEVKVLENLKVDHLRDETNPHVLRVGWSVDSSSLNLGEEALSYGFGGTGKASTECKFVDYGQAFGPGDVITAYLDLESEPAVISFSKNGEDLGTCYEVEKEKLGEQALFPHLMTKNTEFELNFGGQEEAWFPLKEGYVFLENLEQEARVRGSTPPATKEECEVVMMVGLPGAGKTYWVNKYAAENSDKRYFVLGTNNIIDKMKVMGLPRKQNYSGRWDVLIDKSTKCLNRMIEVAARKKHNYIIDQTNVYASARRRKMTPFEGFQRKAVVVLPTDEEFKNRVKQRTEEEGKEIPASAVLEMKANFTLPEESVIFTSVQYTEEAHEKEDREKLVEKYRKEGRDALPPPDKRFRRDRFDNRDFRERRGGYRGGYDRDRRGGGGGYRGGRGGFNSWRPSYDRRGDFRGGYRDDRRRDDRREGGYKGYGGGGWGGGSSWNQGWGGQSYGGGWGASQSGYGGGWGQSYNSGWGGGRGSGYGGGGRGGGGGGYRGWSSYR